ncbi:MAG: response regulator transcription factor [Alphaproteobacteria bacterium]|nr:response regulator transcription factor [Alphaproteobacteria bacterium]
MQYQTPTLPHLLVVDDDNRIRTLLVKFLSDQGFRVNAAANAAEARSHMACHVFDALILDIMMPGEDGIQLTKSLRATTRVPILLLTARDQLDDKVTGFETGADDYLTKPFEPLELLARLKSLIRRSSIPDTDSNPLIHFGDYTFDIQNGRLKNKEELVFLTSTEMILLKTLAQTPGHPFSRDELAQRIGHRVSERTVDVQITRLRKKIGDDPRNPRTLQTIRHIGYALCPD